MRRKWAAIGYRILLTSHFLRVSSRRGASAGTVGITAPGGNTPGSRRPFAWTATRGKGSDTKCEKADRPRCLAIEAVIRL
jgi:hypothetical protein